MNFMRAISRLKNVGLGTVLCGLCAAQADATIAYNNPAGLAANSQLTLFHGAFNLGLVFTANSSISVNAIGAYTASGSFSGTVPVAIYSIDLSHLNTAQQVAGTEVDFSGTMGTLVGQSRMVNITPVILGPGTYAVVAANMGGTVGNPFWKWNITQLSPNPATFNGGSALVTDGWFYNPAVPGGADGATLSPASFANYSLLSSIPALAAGTFDFTPVPEAAGFGLAAVALLGFVYFGRCLWLRSRLA